MSIPVSIDQLINDNIVEWARIEFKEGWNPNSTLKTISAFANDIDNWGGGYIIIGAKEENGRIVRPVTSLDENIIDHVQKELLRYCTYLKPKYILQTEPVTFDGKHLLLVWCPSGYDRPYQCPKKPTSSDSKKTYYIRRLSSTIEATTLDVQELISLTHNIPFDDRINMSSDIKDLSFHLIRSFLQKVNSSLLSNLENKTIEELGSDLRIAGGRR